MEYARHKPINTIIFELCTKIRCDPARREKIVHDHLRTQHRDDVFKNLWAILAHFPWAVTLVLDRYLRGGPLTIPMIKKLMMLHYDDFKKSKYFDEKYLHYNCVGHMDVPAQVKHFVARPTTKGKRKMEQLYCEHDERVRGYVDKAFDSGALPRTMLPNWGIPIRNRLGPLQFLEFEEEVAAFVGAKIAAKLTTGGIMMRLLKKDDPAVGRNIHTHRMWGAIARLIDSFSARPSPKCPLGYYKLFE
jgi:hypothetical protein